MKRCPICGHDAFYVSVHVVQRWMVDDYEAFLGVIDECEAIAHNADDEDLWECTKCHYEAIGYKFNIKEGKTNE